MVVDAIEAGIFNDLGSGSNVDVCIIREKNTQMLRNYRKPNERVHKEQNYKFARGTTAWTREQIRDMVVKEGMFSLFGVCILIQMCSRWTLHRPPRPWRPTLRSWLSACPSLLATWADSAFPIVARWVAVRPRHPAATPQP